MQPVSRGLEASPVCTDLIVLLRALAAAGEKGSRLAKMPKRLECVEVRAGSLACGALRPGQCQTLQAGL